MQFLFQPLTWAFFLVLVPLLIHLINLMRQRRVQWAAMDFLLKSYKKHRRWVWLKQLFLLLARMLAVAAVVAMLANLVTRDEWTNLFSGRTTHHYILLDDSVSMSDRSGSVEAFDLAREAISQICAQAEKQSSLQKVTLLRYSQASKNAASESEAATIADLSGEVVNKSLLQLLDDKKRAFGVSDVAVGPQAALETVENMIEQASDEKSVVHLVSDFRDETWNEPNEIRDVLLRLTKEKSTVQLVRCAEHKQFNLAIVDMSVAEGTQAAGVPFFVNLKIKNYGPSAAENVQVSVTTRFHPTAADGSETTPQDEDLPDVLIENLAVDETVSRQVQVYFPTAGQHVVTAKMAADSVLADNDRWLVVDLPEGVPALLVDDDPQSRGAYFLQSVFQPGTRTNTGIRPVNQPTTYLRDVLPEELARYEVIYLFNANQLDGRSLENLQTYVSNGGGLAIFLGPDSDPAFLNDWHAEGAGLFPLEVQRAAELPLSQNGFDVQFEDHPIFAALRGKRNPFANSIRISQYFKVPTGWKPLVDSGVSVLATLRNGDPLVVEKRVGDGRVIAFLTTADTRWTNWPRQPTFIIVVLQTHAYLSSVLQEGAPRYVGSPIDFQLDAKKFTRDVTFSLPPPAGSEVRPTLQLSAELAKSDSPVYDFSIGQRAEKAGRTGETDRRGIYEAESISVDGVRQFRRFALNVDPRESDLTVVDNAHLQEKLDPVPFQIHAADQIVYGSVSDDGTSWSEIILMVLLPLLLIEQLLAYLASYHPGRGLATETAR